MSEGRWHVVREGEDMASIAYDHGYFWRSLWGLPENEELRKARANPNVLLEGDRVFVPKLRAKRHDAATDSRHRFRRRGVPSKIRLRLLRGGQPRANIDFELRIDGQITTGTTDGDGVLAAVIPPNATRGRLLLFEKGRTERRTIKIGYLEPISDARGVQQRLRNLGYHCDLTGKLDDATTDALLRFQKNRDQIPTGELDDPTRSKLVEAHGC